MGWKGVTVMDQRIRFIAEYLKGYFPLASCALNSVSAGRRPISGFTDMKKRDQKVSKTDHTDPIIVPTKQIVSLLRPS